MWANMWAHLLVSILVYVTKGNIEMFLKFVDLTFPGGTVDIINIPEPPLD